MPGIIQNIGTAISNVGAGIGNILRGESYYTPVYTNTGQQILPGNIPLQTGQIQNTPSPTPGFTPVPNVGSGFQGGSLGSSGGGYSAQTTQNQTLAPTITTTSFGGLTATPQNVSNQGFSNQNLSTQLSNAPKVDIPLYQGFIPNQNYNSPSVEKAYNPSDYTNPMTVSGGTGSFFGNVGYAFGTLWKNRSDLIDNPKEAFSGFSVFNKQVTYSPVEPFGTRPASAEKSFYNTNAMKITTDVPSAITSGLNTIGTTGLIIAAPEVGLGYLVGKGSTDIIQGTGRLSGNAGILTPEEKTSATFQVVGGAANVGLGLVGYKFYQSGLSNQFIKEDALAVLNQKPTFSVANVGKEGNVYTEGYKVNYPKSSLGEAETIGAVQYKVSGNTYNIIKGESTSTVKVYDLFTGNPVRIAGQQSITGSGIILPESGGLSSTLSRITTTETANAYFTPKVKFFSGNIAGVNGKINVFKGGESTTGFYGGVGKQYGKLGLSLSGKINQVGVDNVIPKFDYRFNVEDIRLSRLTERNPSPSESFPNSNVGLKANSPSLVSMKATQEGVIPNIARTIEVNAPSKSITLSRTSSVLTKATGQLTTQSAQQLGFNIPSMVGGQGLKTTQETTLVTLPIVNVRQSLDLGQEQNNKFIYATNQGYANAYDIGTREAFLQPTIQLTPQITTQVTKQMTIQVQTPGLTNPTINPNPTFNTPIIPLFLPKLNLGSERSLREFVPSFQPKKYQPSFFASSFKLKAPSIPKSAITGFSIRPIIVKSMLKGGRKKRK